MTVASPEVLVTKAVVSGDRLAKVGLLEDVAAARLWRAPVCAAAGAAVALGATRLLGWPGGLAAGLIVGCLLFWAFGRTRQDPGAHEQSLLNLGLPLLAAVPVMVTARELQERAHVRRRRRLLQGAAIASSALAALWVVSRLL